MQRIIIVSNRLPVSLDFSGEKVDITSGIGGLATGMKSVHQDRESLWFGWPRYSPRDMNKHKLEETENLLRKNKCSPVYLEKKDIDNYYYGFSNRTLWPLFHYFMQYTEYKTEYWESYKKVNRIFADTIAKEITENDIVWVHDYHLLLLPAMLREKFPDLGIGFFLHIPFPSYEVFRLLPWRNELVEGMLGADLLGFHTYDYERHFRSCAHRLLGYDADFNTIKMDTREIKLDVFPMGIDYEYFENAANEKRNRSVKDKTDIQREIDRYFLSAPDRKLIISIDRLDYSKGIPNRLWAFERFLEKYPEYLEKVTLMMLATPTRSNVPQYQKMKQEVDELVGRINGKYGGINWTPIWYFYRALPLDRLIELYLASEIALITPVRDGMNLVAKEYLASKPDNKGVLILSEMAGSAKEMSEAIIINPNNMDEIADSIVEAINMPVEEQIARNKILKNRLKRYNVNKWATDFLRALKDQTAYKATYKPKNIKATKFHIFKKYKKAKKRILFIDYDGTLTHFKKDPKKAMPDKNLYLLLDHLSSDPKNEVVIVSGRDKNTIDNWFGNRKFKLVAEHGSWLYKNNKWQRFREMNDEWKEIFEPIFQWYVDRTPGSLYEEKDYSLTWHYPNSDPELGKNRSIELKDEITSLIANHDLEIMEGKKVIELKSSGINKGQAALYYLADNSYDFIMAIGDDWTDEYIFHELPKSAYTIRVGSINTEARYFIDGVDAVRDFLKELSKQKV
ncbi:MAG: bifunctional alpha,alpha-trehalose-phosphate synthase (UDP-forming)/trehalose-phosphatase [Candidatus Delongbacteria bacterium]|jgi:trehalose 6-phosphate synthase/phosphatase|nr:bifunctional alpha,alpha-trehalose-phosphate synthase (UDP-forming)/trehalose-phosphatase [Candidatus Delongbacteria bacterium]